GPFLATGGEALKRLRFLEPLQPLIIDDEVQPQRAFDSDPPVAKVLVVKNLRVRAFLKVAEDASDLGDLVGLAARAVADLVPLVAEALPHLDEERFARGVDELNLSLASFRLAVGD